MNEQVRLMGTGADAEADAAHVSKTVCIEVHKISHAADGGYGLLLLCVLWCHGDMRVLEKSTTGLPNQSRVLSDFW